MGETWEEKMKRQAHYSRVPEPAPNPPAVAAAAVAPIQWGGIVKPDLREKMRLADETLGRLQVSAVAPEPKWLRWALAVARSVEWQSDGGPMKCFTCGAYASQGHNRPCARFDAFNAAEAELRAVRGVPAASVASERQSWLPDSFIERAYRMALAQDEFKLPGDTVVGLSAFEASSIRQRVATRRTPGEDTP